MGRSLKVAALQDWIYEQPAMARISRAVLLRETMADLLEKHRVVWSRSHADPEATCDSHEAGKS
jgi:hypothetical protein